jgi:hypothetical protein
MEIDTLTLFITLFFSYIAKDFYDMFFQNNIRKLLIKYKKFLDGKNRRIKV